MIVFPQLKTGAAGQYPLIRRRRYTAVTNLLSDGTLVSYADPTPWTNEWDMALRDLTDTEADAIQQVFKDVEGRRGTFTFVDPTANILAASEEFDNPCWTKSPMIQVTSGMSDPTGGTQALRLINAGQTNQTLSQTLPSPAWFGYCFSVYARSTSGSSLSMTSAGTSSTHTRLFTLGSQWTRCLLSGALNTTDISVQFALDLAAGASVDVFGIQAEAQPSASAYKRTGNRNGIYSRARFDSDVLQQISDGPDQHRIDLKIVAKD